MWAIKCCVLIEGRNRAVRDTMFCAERRGGTERW